MNMIKISLINDIVEKYPHINPDKYFTISSMLRDTNDKFIFIVDEWDYIFSNNLFEENEKALKDESFGYVSQIIENSRKMLNATVNRKL